MLLCCRGKIVMRGHSLPHAVPIQMLYNKHVKDNNDDDKDNAAKMETLLEDVCQHLRAYLSRQEQVNELKER